MSFPTSQNRRQHVVSKLRKSAKGKPCCLQIFPYCQENRETVVLCHLNSPAKGMGIKSPDFFAVYGCSICHDIIDGRAKTLIDKDEILMCQMRGLYRTWEIMIDEGLIKVA